MEHKEKKKTQQGVNELYGRITINEFTFFPMITSSGTIYWVTKPTNCSRYFFFYHIESAKNFAVKWQNAGENEFWLEVAKLYKASLMDVYKEMREPLPELGDRMKLIAKLSKIDFYPIV